MDNYKVYLEKKAGFLDKMLNTSKTTVRGANTKHGLGRSPIYDLRGSLERSSDFGNIASKVVGLTEKADRNKMSILKSYKGLFTPGHSENPAQLYRQARDTVYKPLQGDNVFNAGKTIKEVALKDAEHSIFKALANQSNKKEVENFARALEKDPKQLKLQIKKVMSDYAAGIEPQIHVPTTRGKSMALNIDRPINSYNGSPVVNIEKTLGISGIDSFNEKHHALIKAKNKILKDSKKYDPNLEQILNQKVQDSAHFGDLFEDKLRLMSNSNKSVNSNKFTLDDLDTVEKVEVFLRNPHLETMGRNLSALDHAKITDDIVAKVKLGDYKGQRPQNVLVDVLSDISKDPHKVNYMDNFQFQRYTKDEMKEVLGHVKGTKTKVGDEYVRAGADALGALGITGLGAGLGYAALKPKKKEMRLEAPYETKMLQHKAQGI